MCSRLCLLSRKPKPASSPAAGRARPCYHSNKRRSTQPVMIRRRFVSSLAFLASLALASHILQAQAVDTIDAALKTRVDQIANDVLQQTGVPSASVAIVKGGKLVYAHAYGNARLDPPVPATPDMRYSIGSISKQFTA